VPALRKVIVSRRKRDGLAIDARIEIRIGRPRDFDTRGDAVHLERNLEGGLMRSRSPLKTPYPKLDPSERLLVWSCRTWVAWVAAANVLFVPSSTNSVT
jgi:hypothetical protein